MKPVDVKLSTNIDFGIEYNDKYSKFKVVDHVRTSTCKDIFAKSSAPDWDKVVFVVKKIKILCRRRYRRP